MPLEQRQVLFLCTGNSARSQLAEALLRHIAGDRFAAYSAGTDPKPIHPMTLQVLEEAGVSTAGLYSKDLREYLGKQHFGYLVIVCDAAGHSCPTVWPGVRHRVLMTFEDPAAFQGSEEAKLTKFRVIRDQILTRLTRWIEELDNTATASTGNA